MDSLAITFEREKLVPILYQLSHKCKEHEGKKHLIEVDGLKKELCHDCIISWNRRMANLARLFFV